jgi:hypothetical protein
MAIPISNETARLIHLRSVVEDTDTEQMLAWPRPTDDDFAVFGRIIHTYSAIDFLLRFTAEIMDTQGLLAKSWKGAIAAQSISVISREIQSNEMWNISHRIGFEQIDLHRKVRNMLAHFLVRRIPGEDAFVFLTKSATDFKQVFGEIPPLENMLFGVTDAAEVYGIEPVLKGLLSWLGNLLGHLSRPLRTP